MFGRKRKPAKGSTHGDKPDVARRLVWRRSGGQCEICGAGKAQDFSHRQPSGVRGGDCACNGLAACRQCHADRVHGQPVWAREMGWAVSRHAVGGVRFEPVLVAGRGWVQLCCNGDVRAVSAPV